MSVPFRKSTAVPEARRAINAIRSLMRASRRHASGTSERLSPTQWSILRHLSETPASSISELARRSATNRTLTSQTVQRLGKLGYVSRERASLDSRRARIQLTPEGKALLQHAPRSVDLALVETMQAMTPPERAF